MSQRKIRHEVFTAVHDSLGKACGVLKIDTGTWALNRPGITVVSSALTMATVQHEDRKEYILVETIWYYEE
ncbi:MAG: hypothetical protein COV34_00275 [Candidatus Zambryskibacteria bacterium CG10_big_fil_rev_8_21_14_0_10_42_12]|uniref:Uncharacterized protein n=1 Tax=Candidatus Zambryskibacteria bacterium CG10_big_fil_rev_8_21_14_0_10_42_12 TaxID=1975115 RepID=A0A2H0QX74_9BACT|nr:MAG: hypothetical protein COV34_00275 [Candidatus Zambryskibacteria bacterium CG10_big_fil_rev_8_21_14_0_10_42_12]